MDEFSRMLFKKRNSTEEKMLDNVNDRTAFVRILSQPNNYYYTFRLGIKAFWIYCQKCRFYRAIEVHHVDKNRENNGKLTNFAFLCKTCHKEVHRTSMLKKQKKVQKVQRRRHIICEKCLNRRLTRYWANYDRYLCYGCVRKLRGG